MDTVKEFMVTVTQERCALTAASDCNWRPGHWPIKFQFERTDGKQFEFTFEKTLPGNVHRYVHRSSGAIIDVLND